MCEKEFSEFLHITVFSFAIIKINKLPGRPCKFRQAKTRMIKAGIILLLHFVRYSFHGDISYPVRFLVESMSV